MTPTGFEVVDATSNPALDYANRQTEALQNPVQLDPDLQLVVKVRPDGERGRVSAPRLIATPFREQLPDPGTHSHG
jgi:hypothetical protein